MLAKLSDCVAESLSARLKPTYPNLIVASIRMPSQPQQVDDEDLCPQACPDCSCRSNQKKSENKMDIDQVKDDGSVRDTNSRFFMFCLFRPDFLN